MRARLGSGIACGAAPVVTDVSVAFAVSTVRSRSVAWRYGGGAPRFRCGVMGVRLGAA
jgi:hypothetical protein